MEVSGMDEVQTSESHLTLAAAFVEGGIQEACDDTRSICLEAFCDCDPSTVTSCKHEFHLQCILEWCQRSSQCPMCWQAISLKDPTSQELLEAIECGNDAELEERIIQHLAAAAAAAAMGRAHHIARREGQRNRSSAQGHPQFLVLSTHPSSPPAVPASSFPAQRGENELAPAIAAANPSVLLTAVGNEPSHGITQLPSAQTDQIPNSASGSTVLAANRHGISHNNWSSASHSSLASQDGAGQSDFHSFSESLKSRFNAVSMRYKESISKSTRGWKDRLFSRNNSMADLG
ncbi:hypothetical protein HHK36_032408 [Tetracentron sinense]|uniref:RING-type E3 ubiquitin transferase n=1 Tax=Tetracentron sinense TaxID=13715 RepID=A0A834Y860_TETSI|nr:hypothetical protein HHK36_032408 [Tetracentron sinense]